MKDLSSQLGFVFGAGVPRQSRGYRETIERAGIGGAASVLLTTNDDATNIYVAV